MIKFFIKIGMKAKEKKIVDTFKMVAHDK
jgi:hypothetical protein